MHIFKSCFLLFSICHAQNCHHSGSEKASLLQVDSRPPDAPNAPGIIVWSYGRSATGSFKQSLISATGYTYCQNRNETFSGHAPDVQILENCIRKKQQLLMVKPQHLFEHGGSLQRPQDFFKAAFRVAWRRNPLEALCVFLFAFFFQKPFKRSLP